MKNTPEKSNSIDSRRKFLKKTTAGVVISALPAQSVWGACTVSGALSGGSAISDDCSIVPDLRWGRSPGTWVDPSRGGKIKDMFTAVAQIKSTYGNGSCQYRLAQEQALAVVNYVIDNTAPIDLRDGTALVLRDAIQPGTGHLRHLAAAYLNFYFGFYNQTLYMNNGNITTAEDLVLHLHALVVSGNFSNFTDNEMGYNESTNGGAQSNFAFNFDFASC